MYGDNGDMDSLLLASKELHLLLDDPIQSLVS